jgi:Tol biopolymer transport system component
MREDPMRISRKLVVGAIVLPLVALAACTEGAGPPAPVTVGPADGPVAPSPAVGSDAERSIVLWDPKTGAAETIFSVTAGVTWLTGAELSPDGRYVAYERRHVGYERQASGAPYDTTSQIYLLDTEGNERRLTHFAGGAHDPTWSPDGETIAFAAGTGEGSDTDIFTIPVDGGTATRIAGTWKDDGHPDWSPDGTQIVFDARSGDPHSGRGVIWVASVRTHALHPLTERHTPYAATAPAWSPDGRRIAYRVYHRGYTLNDWPYAAWLGVIRPDGSHQVEVSIPRGGGRPIQAPNWSPDGRSIVVERTDWREMGSVILLVDPSTGEAHRISERLRSADAEPSWGTDGILLTLWSDDPVPSGPAPPRFQVRPRALFRPLADLGAGMHTVNVRTGEASRLPDAFTSIRGARNFEVSPGGSMVLFEGSGRTTPSTKPPDLGHHQLYLANVDGTGLRRLTDDPIGTSQGSWSPDGTRVVYLGGSKSPADLMVLDLATGTTTRVATGRAGAFDDPFFGVDGGTIMFTRYHHERPKDAYGQGYDLWSIPVGGGRPTLEVEGLGYGASFSPDGTAILYQRTATAVGALGRCVSGYGVSWISDADGNHPRLLVPRAGEEPRGSSTVAGWSPDGTRIAYRADLAPPDGCSLSSASGAYVMDMETGARTLIAFGEPIDWLDDRTVIIKRRRGGQG